MMKIFPVGDKALIVKMGDAISPEIHARIRKLLLSLEREPIEGIVDLIPSYNELLIQFDPIKLSYNDLKGFILSFDNKLTEVVLPPGRIVYVPVCYGGEYGPDLSALADFHSLSEEQLVGLHSSTDYLVYMLGFTPGFCYMGGMDERIASPRKSTPGLHIPAGSVGIAGGQTGIYPIASPGGWQIIGRTPLKLFDPGRKPFFLIEMGDFVRFFPVSVKDYELIANEIASGKFIPEIIRNE